MSKGIAVLVLFLAIIAGLFASMTVMKYIQQIQTRNTGNQVETASVVVAQKEIPAGSVVRMEQVKLVDRLEDSIPANAFQSVESLNGRISRTTIYPGEVVLENRLVAPGAIAGLPALIPRGYRAITLKVDDTTGVSGFIHPGHSVDIVTTIDISSVQQDMISKVILQNIKVIATGQEIEIETNEEKKAKMVPTVTVLATLEQAERIALATNAGTIRLVLRNSADREIEDTEGVTLASLIPQSHRDLTPPEPVYIETTEKIEPEPEPVKQFRIIEVYRGSEKSEVTFEK